jgi:tetratricopeptide (TPR) repeat protein
MKATKPEGDLYKLAVGYFEDKNYGQAIAEFTKIIKLNSNLSFLAYNNRGYAYFKNGDLNKAIVDLNQAIKMKPDFEFAYTNRGEIYLSQKNYTQAIADFTVAISINPKFAKALYNRFIAYFEKGNYEEAVSDHNRALISDSSMAKDYYGKIDFEKAIVNLKAQIKLEPDNAVAKNNYETVRDLFWFAKGFGPVGLSEETAS